MPKVITALSKKEVLAFTKEKVNLEIKQTSITHNHICSVKFYPKYNVFLLPSLTGNKVVELSPEEGFALYKDKCLKNLTLISQRKIDELSRNLHNRNSVFTETDYVAPLKFIPNQYIFTAQFGTRIEHISIMAAQTLLKTGKLPNIELLP